MQFSYLPKRQKKNHDIGYDVNNRISIPKRIGNGTTGFHNGFVPSGSNWYTLEHCCHDGSDAPAYYDGHESIACPLEGSFDEYSEVEEEERDFVEAEESFEDYLRDIEPLECIKF